MHDRIQDRRRSVEIERLALLRQGLEELAAMLGPANARVGDLLADAIVACRDLQDRVKFGVVTPADFLGFLAKYQETLSTILATLLQANARDAGTSAPVAIDPLSE